jgi:squalene-hopene/tetraprenyl-beta-curcumene cyclase
MSADGVEAATQWLLERQNAAGWWFGELETNVTMTAEHVLLLRFLGVRLDSIRDGAAEHILRNQREDGSWALYHDAPADLSTTIEAYAALKVLGLDPNAEPMQKALRVVLRLGGAARARVFTKIWLALFGKYPWDGIPTMPPEMVFLPPSIPFNLYDYACWARGTVAPLAVVISRRPTRDLGVPLSEIVVEGTEMDMHRVQGSGFFWWLDRLLKLYERSPVKPGRQIARNRLKTWVVERQEADGGWGGIQPPWVYSLIALNLEGMSTEHPVMRKGLAGLDGFSLHDGENGWRLQACMSPVWDTAWAILALRAAGVERSHPAMQKSVQWLLDEQISGGGDWQIRCKGVECGGWAFEFHNDIYPDIDDTALVVLALLRGGEPDTVREAVERARAWVVAMRSSNGAWAAFDRDNYRELLYRLPFADFGAFIDPPTEDVTAHVVEMLAALGSDASDPSVRSGLDYLRATQKAAGNWFGRWGVNHVYGTWCTISALTALGGEDEMVRRGVAWLLERQNRDGGWGETCHSYVDESFAGVGFSTPSQTAWAVLSLQSAGLQTHEACRRGLAYLRDLQQSDGTWPEPYYTGTGFPRDFYINYHLYRHLFPMMALANDAALQTGATLIPGERSTLVPSDVEGTAVHS